jgi:hypothetical protein
MAGEKNHEHHANTAAQKAPSTFSGFCIWRFRLIAVDSCNLGMDKSWCKPGQFAKRNHEASAHDYFSASADNFRARTVAKNIGSELKDETKRWPTAKCFLSPSLWGSLSIEQLSTGSNRNFDQAVLADHATQRRDA